MVGKVENFFALNKNKGASDSNSAHRPLRRSVHLHIAAQLFFHAKIAAKLWRSGFCFLAFAARNKQLQNIKFLCVLC